jgi:hypothetical protein
MSGVNRDLAMETADRIFCTLERHLAPVRKRSFSPRTCNSSRRVSGSAFVFSEPGLDASSSRFYAERKPIEREVVAVLPPRRRNRPHDLHALRFEAVRGARVAIGIHDKVPARASPRREAARVKSSPECPDGFTLNDEEAERTCKLLFRLYDFHV